MKKVRTILKQTWFAYRVTRKAIKRLARQYQIQPFRVWIREIQAFLAGCIRIEDMPGRVQNQAFNICFLESQKFGYTWFRWKSLNRLAMYFGPNYSCYDFFIVENELD